MLKVEIKNNMIFCPGAGMIVEAKYCEKCRYRKTVTANFIECSFDDIRFGIMEWGTKK